MSNERLRVKHHRRAVVGGSRLCLGVLAVVLVGCSSNSTSSTSQTSATSQPPPASSASSSASAQTGTSASSSEPAESSTPAGSSESVASSSSAPASATTGPVKQQQATLVLDWTWQPYHVPFMRGSSFTDAGLNLELTQGQGSGTSVTLVGQDKYQFGFVDTSAAIIAQAKGVPVENVLVIQQSGAFATQCWKSANVHSPADLKGHTVLMVPAESTAQVWPAYLAVNHIDPASVHVVNATVSNKVTLMVSHKADCMAGLLGQDTLQAGLANSDIDTPMPWAADGIELFGYSLIASDAVVKQNPDLVKSMVSATIDSWKDTCADQASALADFAKLHPELARTDADKAYNTGNLEAACAQTKPPAGVDSQPLGASSADQWDTVINTLKQYGGLSTSEPASAFYTNDFIPTS